jgi:serine/threonine protein kinase
VESQSIGKYKVLGKIGQGSMGVVYEANDPILNRRVAIKTMSESLGSDEDARKRFLREAQSAARLNHPNIVTVFDLGEDQGRVYMAMELLGGKDLGHLMGTPALGLLEEKLRIMEEVCDGMAFAHAKEVIHRDIKPANIHVQPNGSVKVMDFGLARLGTSEMTAKGTSMGTPNYMSPEQIRGEKTDARSDVFSLGTVFYEILTNHKAFDGDSLHTILAKVAESNPPPPRRWVSDLPEILVRFLDRSVAKDPTRRFRNAGEMRIALGVVAQVLAGRLPESEGLTLLEPNDGDAEATAILPSPGATVIQPGARSEPGTRSALSRGPALTRGPALPRRKPRVGTGSTPSAPRIADASDTVPPGGSKASRLPIVLAIGVAGLVVAGGALWLWTRGSAGSREISREHVGALTDALVASKLDLAQEGLKDKDYAGAIAQAEAALKLDPQSAEAKQFLDKVRATLKDLDAAADEARAAVQSGDTDAASRALARVMAINPNHPVVPELSAQLNSHFRSQAEEARTAMTTARTAAERGNAGSVRPFADATEAARIADRSFAGGEFTVATRKFLESRDGFAKALRLAEVQQAAARTPAPTLAPATTMASASLPPPPSIPPGTPSPSASATIAPTAVPTPVPSASASVRPPPPSSAPIGGAADDAAIRKVVEDFARAVQGKDLVLYRAVKPNLSADEEKRLRAIFKQAKSYKVVVTGVTIQFEGAEAKVRVSQQHTVDGASFALQQLLTMVKTPTGWIIRDIGQ